MDSDNYPITLCLLSSQEPPKAYNVLRTFQSPSESISPMDIRFCFVVLAQLPNPLRVLSRTQPLAEVMSNWLWAIGDWLWVGMCDCTIIYLLALPGRNLNYLNQITVFLVGIV